MGEGGRHTLAEETPIEKKHQKYFLAPHKTVHGIPKGQDF